MTLTALTIRLLIALLLGALIGLERQWRQRSAGLRTNTLVSLGSAAFIALSMLLTSDVGDPSRVAGQIVTGIGFLGAGVIMKHGLSVQGLNTAATIWCSAAVGSLAGAGLFGAAALTAGAVLATHLMLRPLGLWLGRLGFSREESGIHVYRIEVRCMERVENHLRVLLMAGIRGDEHLQLRSLSSSDNDRPGFAHVEATIRAIGRHDNHIEQLVGKLTLEYGVLEASWEVDHETNEH
jgi:putative Mg2+ transporter-C (MgtC) family protein